MPWHSGQAPCGVLNEKVRGSISGIVVPWSGQARYSENLVSSGGSADRLWIVSTPGTLSLLLGFRFTQHQSVNDCFDRVVFVAVEFDLIFTQVNDLTVDPSAHESGPADLFQYSLMGTFAVADHRCEHQQPAPGGHAFDRLDDLLGRLLDNFLAADRAVWDTDAGEQQAQVIIYLRHRANGRAWVV
jgi:hypothetical protein